jgi:hypothetical protein
MVDPATSLPEQAVAAGFVDNIVDIPGIHL